MGARNDAELRALLEPALQKAVDYTADKILEENYDIIQEVVYNAGSPNVYGRTYTFGEAWEATSEGGGGISSEFKWAPEKLGYHPSVFTGEDVRQGLVDIIYEGMAGHVFGTGFWTTKRNAFKQLQKVLGKNKLRQYFEAGMTAAGLRWKRHTSGIGLDKS